MAFAIGLVMFDVSIARLNVFRYVFRNQIAELSERH